MHACDCGARHHAAHSVPMAAERLQRKTSCIHAPMTILSHVRAALAAKVRLECRTLRNVTARRVQHHRPADKLAEDILGSHGVRLLQRAGVQGHDGQLREVTRLDRAAHGAVRALRQEWQLAAVFWSVGTAAGSCRMQERSEEDLGAGQLDACSRTGHMDVAGSSAHGSAFS